MPNNLYYCTRVTGGVDGALDFLDPSNVHQDGQGEILVVNDVAFVVTGNNFYVYVLKDASPPAKFEPPHSVQPLSNPGSFWWSKVTSFLTRAERYRFTDVVQDQVLNIVHGNDANDNRIVQVIADGLVQTSWEVKIFDATNLTVKKTTTGTAAVVQVNVYYT